MDIFDRVNSGVRLTRQQMRNALYMGAATRFLKDEARTKIFLQATGYSLEPKIMRDREFVNRFCAFQLLNRELYTGNMDEFLAQALKKMNGLKSEELSHLSADFQEVSQIIIKSLADTRSGSIKAHKINRSPLTLRFGT